MAGLGYQPSVYDAEGDVLKPFESSNAFFAGGNKNLYFVGATAAHSSRNAVAIIGTT